MSVAGTLSFCRRWCWLGLVGSAILWICYFVQTVRDLQRENWNPHRIVFAADHLAFYTGARLTRFGPEDKLYDYVFVSRYQNDMFEKARHKDEKDVWTWLEAFRNPPFYAMLYWPTCGWTYLYSSYFWFGLSILFTIIGTSLLTDDRRFWWRLAWVFSFLPTFAAFEYGQNTPLSFLLFATVFVLLKKEKPLTAGLVAGFLLFKPQLLLGLGIWALLDIRRKWPCALGVLITGSFLAALSWTVLPEASRGFIDSFNQNLKFDSFDQYKMHNPLSTARLLFPADKIAAQFAGEKPKGLAADDPEEPYNRIERRVRLLHYVFAVTCGLAAIAVFVKLWWHRRDDVAVMFGGAVFLTLWANPHTLIYEWMLLAITGLLWVKEWRTNPNAWFLLYAAAWGVLYFSTELNAKILDYFPVTIQWSVPVLALVGWYGVKLLTKPQTATQMD